MKTHFMAEAVELAKIAAKNNEVPIGAVVVHNDQIIGSGYNTRESANQITGHAEINAIKEAANTLNS